MSAPAADEALAAALAGVAGDWGEAGETRAAFVLEAAELGHVNQQGERSRLANAGDAHEDVEAGLQGRIGGELGVQGGVDGGDLALLGLTLVKASIPGVGSWKLVKGGP